MHRNNVSLTGKSGTELNWISARCKNPDSFTCTTKHKDLEGFPPRDTLRIKDKGLAPKMSCVTHLFPASYTHPFSITGSLECPTSENQSQDIPTS